MAPPQTPREWESPAPACEFPGDLLQVLPGSPLQHDAHEHSKCALVDVPLTSLTLSDEPLACSGAAPQQAEEVRAWVGHDIVQPQLSSGLGVATQAETSKDCSAAEERNLAQSELSGSLAPSDTPFAQQEMEMVPGRETLTRGEEKLAPNLPSEVQCHVGLQSSFEAKDISRIPKVKTLYPQLPTEVVEVPALVVEKSLIHHKQLYPELPSQPDLVPFTKEQLKIFEPGSWLENVEACVEEFDSLAHQDHHELYELLLNYSRCRKQLLLAEAELLTMTADCQNARSRLWHFKEEQVSAQVFELEAWNALLAVGLCCCSSCNAVLAWKLHLTLSEPCWVSGIMEAILVPWGNEAAEREGGPWVVSCQVQQGQLLLSSR